MDEQLCEVVDRLRAMGHRHTLEVQLRFARVEDDSSNNDFTKILPRFEEKGVVTIIDRACGDLVYRSSALVSNTALNFRLSYITPMRSVHVVPERDESCSIRACWSIDI